MTVTSKQQLLSSQADGAKENLLEVKWGPEKKIEFLRDVSEELGITVVHGRMYTNNNALGSISGLFIKSIAPNSAAGRTGKFQSGDKILEVCGTYVDELSREDAIAFIRTVENPISFVVQSMKPVRKPVYSINGLQENEHQDVNKLNEGNEHKEPPEIDHELDKIGSEQINKPEEKILPAAVQYEVKIPAESESEESEEEDEDELESHDLATVKKKFALIENKIEVEIEKGPSGLGLCLAGHKNRNKMAVFVCGINPSSPVYKSGGIQVGDEILQVNDAVVYGHSHLNASSIIKHIAGPKYKFLISRRKFGTEEVAVRPVTYFPEVLQEETTQQKYEKYPNVRELSIEKGSATLGIMIIEGKHAELGQGIFISDIQEESPAEKAGLEIGEMILAVNKDTLVGATYDKATSLLKRSEGVVLLTLSSPTKKISESPIPPEIKAEEPTRSPSPLPASKQPSRATTPVPVDPATCPIIPDQKTTIEISMEGKALGLFIACSPNTSNSNGVFVIDIYNGGAAEKDGRLQPGDEILEAGETVFKDVPNDFAIMTLHQISSKVKLVVLRPQTAKYKTVQVELMKAPGKGIGLSMLGRKSDKGAFISEILEGSNAQGDGKIAKGDLLVSVNDINVENASADEVGAALKTATGRTLLKFNRYTSTAR